MEKALRVDRKTYKSKDGTERFMYYVMGKIRGKEYEASVIPSDIGGYEVLDIVFGEENSAEFVLVPYSMKDEKTGKEVSGFTYEARNFDKDGHEYKCKVKPRFPSDKDLLSMFLAS